jgi:hypothetical protein
MKLAALAIASLVALVDTRIADACEPATTCGDEFCWGSIGVIEGTIEESPLTENFRSSILIHVTNAWGMTDGIPVGTNARLATGAIFSGEDIGKSYVLYLERNSEGDLSIERGITLADYWTTMCFGADVTAEQIATTALAQDCYHTLTPVEPDPPHCPTGVGFGCDAGGSRGAGSLAVVVVGLVAGRRRRRR